VEEIWGRSAFLEAILPALEECFQGDEVHYQAWFEIPAAGPRLFDVSFYPQARGTEGKPSAVVVSRDITDQPTLFEVLEGMSTAVQDSTSPVFIMDGKGILQSVNGCFESLLNVSSEKAKGRSIWDFLSRVESASQSDGPMIATSQVPWTGTVLYRDKDGDGVEVHARFSPIRDFSGRVLGFLGLLRHGISEKAIREELRSDAYFSTMKNFAAGVAHDFNNLLTVILSSASFLEETLPNHDPVASRILQQIESAGKRASFLSRQLMNFSRNIENSKVDLDLRPLLREAVRMVQSMTPDMVSIEFDLAAELPTVLADPTKVHQIFLNLLLNARDAVGERGRILVGAEWVGVQEGRQAQTPHLPPGEYVVLRIEDDGCGIPPPLRRKIFDPFFTTKGEGKGTGLGLPNVVTLVSECSGFIHLCSELGKGTVFQVLFPTTSSLVLEPSKETLARDKDFSTPFRRRVEDILLQGPGSLCPRCEYMRNDRCLKVSQELE
jgi:PAS domain S-box-containing protein